MLDWLLQGALVASGTGSELRKQDIGISNGRLHLLPSASDAAARNRLNVAGKVVAPGFIDIHAHNDLVPFVATGMNDKITQGVTTEVDGNCGFSAAPITDRNRHLQQELLQAIAPGDWSPSWRSWSDYQNAVLRAGSSTNIVGQVGHGALRSAVMGLDLRAPTDTELAQMRALLAQCLEEGAAGLSFGLMYQPGSFAEARELRALCEVVAAQDGFISIHLRDYAHEALLGAMDEILMVTRQVQARLQLSHLSPTGPFDADATPAMLAYIDALHDAGEDIAFDRYPYEHAFSQIGLLCPAWLLADGERATLVRLNDPAQLEKARADIARIGDQFGFANIVLREKARHDLVDRDLVTIADGWSTTPAGAAVQILQMFGTSAAISIRLSDMATQERVLQHPCCMVGSDGVPCMEGTHPRTFGTFPRVLGPLVRRGVLTLPQAIYKMTGQPASWLGLDDRGRVEDGWVADLTIFDPATVTDESSFDDPYRPARGIEHVFVAGEPVLRAGQVMNATPGRFLSPRRRYGAAV